MIYARRTSKISKLVSHCITVNYENEQKLGFAEYFIKICSCDSHRRCFVNCQNHSQFYAYFKEAITDASLRVPLNMSLLQYSNAADIRWADVPYISKLEGEHESPKVINIKCITDLCFLIQVQNTVSLIPPPNTVEYDE